jgi:hypothetical protein
VWILCYIARFGVTEIGEKEKMKNTKIAATIIVLSLFLATFAVLPIVFKANAVTMYHLDVYTNPSAIPVPPGTNDYTPGTYVQLNATDPVIIGNTKYIFSYWDIDGAGSYGNPLQWVLMDAYHNATAHYNTQYKVTIADPGLPGVTVGIYVDGGGWVTETSAWVDSSQICWVGVHGLWSSPAGVYFDPPTDDKWIYLVNFTVNGVQFGNHVSGADPTWMCSDMITVNGYKAGDTVWAMMYQLHVSNTLNPPVPTPGGAGWYYANTIVPLIAPEYNPGGGRRYILDRWTVDGNPASVNGTGWLNVLMDKNHTAIALYKRQSFVYLLDNLFNASGIEDTGNWYDDGVVYTFGPPHVPQDVSVGLNVRYDFRYWDKPSYVWTSSSFPLSIAFDASWDGEHLRARYQTQYYCVIQSSPTVGGYTYTDSPVTGWFDAWSLVTLKARPEVDVGSQQRYIFQDWTNQFGAGPAGVNNLTVTADQPYVWTAVYQLQWLITWSHSPSSITVTGSPGQDWRANDTVVWYNLPLTDTGTQFQFYYWTINGVNYTQGANNVHVTDHLAGPISGTAYYANMTKIFMSPNIQPEQSPAYCTLFNVTAYAANFDANRLDTFGHPMDIYGFDIKVKWDPTLLDLKSVTSNLVAFFAPNAYYVAVNNTDHVNGVYELAAAVKGNYTGFSGTKAMFTMLFHVIYDACYPNAPGCSIYFLYGRIENHLGQDIQPELGWPGCWYQLNTVQPMLDVRNAADKSHLVKVDMNVPQQFFDVEVYLWYGVKVSDFYVIIHFDYTQINALSVAMGTYLQPPYIVNAWSIDNNNGNVYVQLIQDPSVSYQNGSGVLFTIHFAVTNQIYYKIVGPFTLSSVISVSYGELSAHCPGLVYQTTNNLYLGTTPCNYVYNPLPGDLNFDGYVNVLDLQLIADNWGTGNYNLFGDGRCDLNELVFVALRFGNKLPGLP